MSGPSSSGSRFEELVINVLTLRGVGIGGSSAGLSDSRGSELRASRQRSSTRRSTIIPSDLFSMVKHATCYFIFAVSQGCCEGWVIDKDIRGRVNFGLEPESARMRRTALTTPRSWRSRLHARWWESASASSSDTDPDAPSLISPQMEREVLSSARATMDTNTVNRALTSLIDESSNGNLRELATRSAGSSPTAPRAESPRDDQQGSNVWTTQQIALASGVSVLVLSPGRNFHLIEIR